MRRYCILVAALTAGVLLSVHAGAAPVSFHVPAQLQAEHLEIEANRALLILPPGDSWQAQVANATVTSGERHQYAEAKYAGPYNLGFYYKDKARDHPAPVGWTDLELVPPGGAWSSIIIEADSLLVETRLADASVETTRGNLADRWTHDDEMHELHPRSLRNPSLTPLLLMEDASESVFIVATGLKRIEWHDAIPSCPSGQDCPKPSPSGPVVEFVEYRFSSGALRLTARPHILALTGPMDLAVNGTVRLPSTTGNIPCTDCNLTEDILTMRGDIRLTLQGALDENPPQIQADLDGSFLARVNEENPRPVGTSSATFSVVATGVGLFFLARFIAAFVSQRILAEPLEHPTRRSIYHMVEAQPGATPVDLRTATGVGEGNLRHHLHILERAGIVKHWRDGRKIHYAVREAKAALIMQQRALDDDGLAELYRYLDNPRGRVQLGVVHWAEESVGWARSTTQTKLRQLCSLGLVEVRKDGFRKVYRAVRVATVDT